MEEQIPEATSQTSDKAQPSSAAVDEKKSSSLNREPSGPSDVESKSHPEETSPNPPMTWRRFMAIFSLGCLLAAAQIPIYLIGGALRDLHFLFVC